MVGLPGQIGRQVVVGVLGLERGVAQIAPEHGEHPELVRLLEHRRHFLQLALRFFRAEIDRRSDAERAHVERLLHAGEADLVVRIGVRDELVVVDLEDERNPVGVTPRHRTEHAQRRRHGVAAAFDPELDDVFRIEVRGIWRERSAGRMFDALIDRQNRHVASAAETSGVDHGLQRSEHARRPIGLHEHSLDEIGTWQGEGLFGNRPALMLQQAGIVAENAFNSRQTRLGYAAYWSHCVTSQLLSPRSYYGPPSLKGASANPAGVRTEAGNSNSSTTASLTAFSTSSSIGSDCSATSMSARRALVCGLRGVNSVQQSWSGMIEIG